MIPVGSSPVISLIKNSDARSFFQRFKEDEIFSAKVISKKNSQGQVRLLINGKAVSITTAMDLSLGQEVRLSLTHEKNGISLKFLSGQEEEKNVRAQDGTVKGGKLLYSKSSMPSGQKTGQGLLESRLVSFDNKSLPVTGGSKNIFLQNSGRPLFFRMMPGIDEKSLLLPGEKESLLEAKVLTKPDYRGVAKIFVKGQEISVQTNASFSPDQKIRIALSRGTSGLRMELVDSKNLQINSHKDSFVHKFQNSQNLFDARAGFGSEIKNSTLPFLANALSKSPELHKLFSGKEPALEKIFSALSLKSDMPDKDFLPRLVSLGGLMFEKKIASAIKGQGASHLRQILPNILKQDAKGQALAIIESTPVAGEKTAVSIGNSFADTIESVQIINSHSSDSGRYFLPFPIADFQGFRLGQMFVDMKGQKEREKDKSKKNIKIAFLLDMSKMGAVRADFSILDKAITGRFMFENTQALEHVEPMIPVLKERLLKVGFHASIIDCAIAKPEEIDQAVFMDACVQKASESDVHIVI